MGQTLRFSTCTQWLLKIRSELIRIATSPFIRSKIAATFKLWSLIYFFVTKRPSSFISLTVFCNRHHKPFYSILIATVTMGIWHLRKWVKLPPTISENTSEHQLWNADYTYNSCFVLYTMVIRTAKWALTLASVVLYKLLQPTILWIFPLSIDLWDLSRP